MTEQTLQGHLVAAETEDVFPWFVLEEGGPSRTKELKMKNKANLNDPFVLQTYFGRSSNFCFFFATEAIHRALSSNNARRFDLKQPWKLRAPSALSIRSRTIWKSRSCEVHLFPDLEWVNALTQLEAITPLEEGAVAIPQNSSEPLFVDSNDSADGSGLEATSHKNFGALFWCDMYVVVARTASSHSKHDEKSKPKPCSDRDWP